MTAPVKAFLETETGKRIPFLFNPTTLIVKRAVDWNTQASPGKNAPSLTFGQGKSSTLTFDMMLDTTDTGADVSTYTNRLLDLMKVDTQRKRPPWVRFGWGKLNSYKHVVEDVTLTFMFFAADGTPLRAKAAVSLKQYMDETTQPLQNPTSGTRKRDRLHEVKPGETLDRISYQVYGDATAWRVIAERNRIMDPFRLPAGLRLVIPEREAVARGY